MSAYRYPCEGGGLLGQGLNGQGLYFYDSKLSCSICGQFESIRVGYQFFDVVSELYR